MIVIISHVSSNVIKYREREKTCPPTLDNMSDDWMCDCSTMPARSFRIFSMLVHLLENQHKLW